MRKTIAKLKDIDIDKLVNYDWRWNIDADYDNLSDNCECRNDYCRCSTIENIRINSVDIDTIAKEICGTPNRFLRYCVNRILNHSEMRDTNYWDLLVCGGYYGEEIDRAVFNGKFPIEQLNTLLAHKDNNVELIKTILIDEYGYLLPELEKFNSYHIEEVPLNEIAIGQDEHYRRLDKKVVERYKGFDLPLAVCLLTIPHKWTGEKLRLIDGYNRIAMAKQENKRIVEAIIGRCD